MSRNKRFYSSYLFNQFRVLSDAVLRTWCGLNLMNFQLASISIRLAVSYEVALTNFTRKISIHLCPKLYSMVKLDVKIEYSYH